MPQHPAACRSCCRGRREACRKASVLVVLRTAQRTAQAPAGSRAEPPTRLAQSHGTTEDMTELILPCRSDVCGGPGYHIHWRHGLAGNEGERDTGLSSLPITASAPTHPAAADPPGQPGPCHHRTYSPCCRWPTPIAGARRAPQQLRRARPNGASQRLVTLLWRQMVGLPWHWGRRPTVGGHACLTPCPPLLRLA